MQPSKGEKPGGGAWIGISPRETATALTPLKSDGPNPSRYSARKRRHQDPRGVVTRCCRFAGVCGCGARGSRTRRGLVLRRFGKGRDKPNLHRRFRKIGGLAHLFRFEPGGGRVAASTSIARKTVNTDPVPAPKKKRLGTRFPGITRHAKLLGVNKSQLWRVATGRCQNPELLQRFRELVALETGRSIILPRGTALKIQNLQDAWRLAAEIGPDRCLIEGELILLTVAVEITVSQPVASINPGVERISRPTEPINAEPTNENHNPK